MTELAVPCFTWTGVEVGVRGSGDGLGVDMGEPLLIKKRNKVNKRHILNPSKKMLMVLEDKDDKWGKENGTLCSGSGATAAV